MKPDQTMNNLSEMIFLRNKLFLCLERIPVAIDMQSSIIHLTKSMRKPNAQLAYFSYLFQVTANCGLGVMYVFVWVQ